MLASFGSQQFPRSCSSRLMRHGRWLRYYLLEHSFKGLWLGLRMGFSSEIELQKELVEYFRHVPGSTTYFENLKNCAILIRRKDWDCSADLVFSHFDGHLHQSRFVILQTSIILSSILIHVQASFERKKTVNQWLEAIPGQLMVQYFTSVQVAIHLQLQWQCSTFIIALFRDFGFLLTLQLG